MDRILVETKTEERRLDCLLMSSNKIQKFIRKTPPISRRDVDFIVMNVTPAA
jgi:hypothetical protein